MSLIKIKRAGLTHLINIILKEERYIKDIRRFTVNDPIIQKIYKAFRREIRKDVDMFRFEGDYINYVEKKLKEPKFSSDREFYLDFIDALIRGGPQISAKDALMIAKNSPKSKKDKKSTGGYDLTGFDGPGLTDDEVRAKKAHMAASGSFAMSNLYMQKLDKDAPGDRRGTRQVKNLPEPMRTLGYKFTGKPKQAPEEPTIPIGKQFTFIAKKYPPGNGKYYFASLFNNMLEDKPGHLLKKGMGGPRYKRSNNPKQQTKYVQIKGVQSYLKNLANNLTKPISDKRKERRRKNLLKKIKVLKVDGSYGTNMYNAVVAFQRFQGIPVDGIVGRNTISNFHPDYARQGAKIPISGRKIDKDMAAVLKANWPEKEAVEKIFGKGAIYGRLSQGEKSSTSKVAAPKKKQSVPAKKQTQAQAVQPQQKTKSDSKKTQITKIGGKDKIVLVLDGDTVKASIAASSGRLVYQANNNRHEFSLKANTPLGAINISLRKMIYKPDYKYITLESRAGSKNLALKELARLYKAHKKNSTKNSYAVTFTDKSTGSVHPIN